MIIVASSVEKGWKFLNRHKRRRDATLAGKRTETTYTACLAVCPSVPKWSFPHDLVRVQPSTDHVLGDS